MKHSLPQITRSVLVAILLLVCSISALAQIQYADGARKGLVTVKFTPAATASLPQVKVNARNNQLITGMAAFDAKARVVQAHSM